MNKFKLALIQLAVGTNKAANLERAASLIRKAAGNGAQVVSLPECFNSPYGVSHFPTYAESIPGESTEMLSSVAKDCGIYIIGGSIPEKDEGKLYNTSVAFDTKGNLVGKYRKIHLFDIDIPGGIRFQESEVLSPGNKFLTIDTEWCKIGIGICYDIRFQDIASIYNQKGCKLLFYPGAFNMVTGPVHWELLARGRALDNQCYVAVVSPARDETAGYVCWGHTSLVDPWGKVVESADEKETIVYGEIDLDYLEKVRREVPISKQKQLHVYTSAQAKEK